MALILLLNLSIIHYLSLNSRYSLFDLVSIAALIIEIILNTN